MTEYATEIERLTITLEDMEIKTSSLEPKLFERIRLSLATFEKEETLSLEEVNDLWNNLNEDFTKLNQNYQDFLKKFNEPKSEELLQSVLFLQFKSEIIKYLRDFIKGYQNNVHHIKNSINRIQEDMVINFLSKLNSYYKNTPMIGTNFDFVYFEEVNHGKINNIFKWFTGTPTQISEGEKLMNTTNNIIVKITKYANSLVELHGNMTNRREEYKHLAHLFDKLDNIDEANRYASVIFGIENVHHFVANSNLNTDTIVNTYDIPPIEIVLSSRTKMKKEKIAITPIVDKTEEKRRLLEEYRKTQEQNRQILTKLIKDNVIELTGEMELSKVERRYIQKLLANNNKKETEFGLSYQIIKENTPCVITSPDGVFTMSGCRIEFERSK